jgi:hypothetical protein
VTRGEYCGDHPRQDQAELNQEKHWNHLVKDAHFNLSCLTSTLPIMQVTAPSYRVQILIGGRAMERQVYQKSGANMDIK